MSIGFYALLAAVKRVTKESLIEVENLNIVVIKEPDA